MNQIIFYFIILIALNAGMIYCAYIAKAFKTELGTRIYHIELVAVVLIFVACVYMLSQNETVCYAARGLFYFMSDIIVVCLLKYAKTYTELIRENKKFLLCIRLFYCLEGVSLLINIRTHHVFELKPVNSFDLLQFYKISNPSILFYIHFAFFYFIMAVVLVMHIIKFIAVPRFYKRKYGMILFAFGIAMAVNIFCWPLELTVDYSLWTYCIMGIAICYFSLIFLPNGLIEKTFATVIKDLNSGIVCYDLNGLCIYLNDVAKDVLGVKRAEDLNEQTLFETCYKNSKKIMDNFIEWEEDRETEEGKYIYRFYYQHFMDETGKKVGSYLTIHDKTEEIAEFEQEHFKATHDSLTGLLNREYFFQSISERIQKNSNKEYCLVYTDIKDFKLVNDLFGVEKGNEVLINLARLISENCPKDFLFGRLMGDKYAFLIPTLEFEENVLIERLGKVSEVFETSDFHLHINAGVYKIVDREEAPSIMCDKAAMALETLLDDYSRIVAYYDNQLMEKAMEDRRLVNEFDKAIENGEFCFYIQPQCDANGEVKGGEALVRWIHPEYGFMSPARFIDLYEKTGIIYKLDEYIWEEAAKKLQSWKKNGFDDFYISVNISPYDFYYANIYQIITNLIEKYEIDAINYKLEITETAVMSEEKRNLRIINRLKKYGFEVEMDDFGSGYSSLNTLKDIPADVLKIDMGFLSETRNIEKSRVILESVINLAHKLGMSVVCEGVETKEHFEMLKELGCEMFQGYYFAKPMPVKEFEEKYMKS